MLQNIRKRLLLTRFISLLKLARQLSNIGFQIKINQSILNLITNNAKLIIPNTLFNMSFAKKLAQLIRFCSMLFKILIFNILLKTQLICVEF